MKFGLAFASSIANEQGPTFDVCRAAEASGFESLWGGEHVIMPSTIESSYPYTEDGKVPAEPETPIPDPLIWLAFAAAAAPSPLLVSRRRAGTNGSYSPLVAYQPTTSAIMWVSPAKL